MHQAGAARGRESGGSCMKWLSLSVTMCSSTLMKFHLKKERAALLSNSEVQAIVPYVSYTMCGCAGTALVANTDETQYE